MNVELVAVDAGRSSTKTIGNGIRDSFPSVLGEYRELKLERKMKFTDMVVEYQGKKFYVGDVARDESVTGAQLMIKTKAHLDTKIFILTALHRVLDDDASVFLITGEPIDNHTAGEKLRMKQLLLGEHEITVNGQRKTFHIARVEVAPEGATASWALRRHDRFHLVDAGSRTVNFATSERGAWVDRHSGTLDFGLETTGMVSMELFARMVIAELSKKVGTLSPIVTVGGKAQHLADCLETYHQPIEVHPNPYFANAQAFYDLGVKVREAQQA